MLMPRGDLYVGRERRAGTQVSAGARTLGRGFTARVADSTGLTLLLCVAAFVAVLLTAPAVALGATATARWVPGPLNAEGSNPATTFHIERKTGTCASTTGTFVEIGMITAAVRVYVDTTVELDVPYCYRMAAGNPSGKSEFTSGVDFIRPLVPPSTPTGLVVTPGS
jgi:hypothetical protein